MGRARQPQTPSHEFDPAIEELAGAFGLTAATIAGAIAAEAPRAILADPVEASARLEGLLENIMVALGSLLGISAAWSEEHVPAVYRRGVQGSLAALGGDLPPSGSGDESVDAPAHDVAIEAARNKIDAELASAVNGMGSEANAELQEIRRRSTMRALAQDSPLGNRLADDFAGSMRDRGITFRDKSGREWQPEAYARMVLRTNVAATLNAGHLNKALELGSRYVRVSDGGPGDVDEPCRIANGQVWHVLYAALHMLEHPNCRRSFAALDPSYSGPVDRGAPEIGVAA